MLSLAKSHNLDLNTLRSYWAPTNNENVVPKTTPKFLLIPLSQPDPMSDKERKTKQSQRKHLLSLFMTSFSVIYHKRPLLLTALQMDCKALQVEDKDDEVKFPQHPSTSLKLSKDLAETFIVSLWQDTQSYNDQDSQEQHNSSK